MHLSILSPGAGGRGRAWGGDLNNSDCPMGRILMTQISLIAKWLLWKTKKYVLIFAIAVMFAFYVCMFVRKLLVHTNTILSDCTSIAREILA